MSTNRAWRYVEEAVGSVVSAVTEVDGALRKDGLHLLVLDGTLIACDRVHSDRPCPRA
ncbi:hypothetical protein [Actinomadura macra]|uniref:hypothetical protein n=1 Tax=Actinomadura macra TaxID=46164 RepID=UPI0012FBA076|nr:hypothetical protein [Actinomadura macra]